MWCSEYSNLPGRWITFSLSDFGQNIEPLCFCFLVSKIGVESPPRVPEGPGGVGGGDLARADRLSLGLPQSQLTVVTRSVLRCRQRQRHSTHVRASVVSPTHHCTVASRVCLVATALASATANYTLLLRAQVTGPQSEVFQRPPTLPLPCVQRPWQRVVNSEWGKRGSRCPGDGLVLHARGQ